LESKLTVTSSLTWAAFAIFSAVTGMAVIVRESWIAIRATAAVASDRSHRRAVLPRLTTKCARVACATNRLSSVIFAASAHSARKHTRATSDQDPDPRCRKHAHIYVELSSYPLRYDTGVSRSGP
jgi:hypothetical protein